MNRLASKEARVCWTFATQRGAERAGRTPAALAQNGRGPRAAMRSPADVRRRLRALVNHAIVRVRGRHDVRSLRSVASAWVNAKERPSDLGFTLIAHDASMKRLTGYTLISPVTIGCRA